jgi:hypothetical protein
MTDEFLKFESMDKQIKELEDENKKLVGRLEINQKNLDDAIRHLGGSEIFAELQARHVQPELPAEVEK